jgi:3'(2'), 5'-bisphosphate nucleotidase
VDVNSDDLDLWPLAREASRVLLEYRGPRRSELSVRSKGEPDDLVTRADAAVQELTIGWLAERSKFPVVGEEGGADEGGTAFWSLDPLDGTREFVADLDEFAFQLALVQSGEPSLAVLALPAYDIAYLARRGAGMRCLRLSDAREVPLPAPLDGPERLVLSRSLDHRPDLQRLVEGHPAGRRLSCGSVGAKIHALLRGEADTYLAAPRGMYGWDLAAPLLVAREAGFWTSDLRGRPLLIPAGRALVESGILVTRASLRDANLAYLRGRLG